MDIECDYFLDEDGAFLFIDDCWNEIDIDTGDYAPVVLH